LDAGPGLVQHVRQRVVPAAPQTVQEEGRAQGEGGGHQAAAGAHAKEGHRGTVQAAVARRRRRRCRRQGTDARRLQQAAEKRAGRTAAVHAASVGERR